MRLPLAVALLVAVLGSPALAQLPLNRLFSVFPPVAQPGQTLVVTPSGADGDGLASLDFSGTPLTATPPSPYASTLNLSVPAELPPGLYEVRVSGLFGPSNPRPFRIDPRPSFTLAGTNLSAASATVLPLDTLAAGRTVPNQVLWFRFDARAGQRIVARVEARELDSRLLPELTLCDARGRELAVARRRPILDFTPSSDGPHLLKLNDQTFRGGDDYVFLLALTTTPQLEFAIPQVLAPGETRPVTLYGRNLPGGRPSSIRGADGMVLDQVVVPVTAPAGPPPHPQALPRKPASASVHEPRFAWSWASPRGPSSPIEFSLSPLPVVAPPEGQPPTGLLPVQPPVEISAFFPRRAEVSGATWESKKGDVWWLEVFADRTGPNADPSGTLQRLVSKPGEPERWQDLGELADTENPSGGREFEAGHRDAAFRFQAPETARYRVLLRDLFRTGPDAPQLPYRLQIRPESPGFTLAAFPQPPPRRDDNDRQIHLWTSNLRLGETVPIRVLAFRRDGFTGDIELEARNLPPGTTAAPVRIPAGQPGATLFLTADREQARGRQQIQIVGRATIQGAAQTRTAAVATARWPVPNWDQERGDARLTDGLDIAILGESDAGAAVIPATNRLEVAPGAKVSVPLRIVRHGTFEAAFNLKPSGTPELDKAPELAIPEKATQATWELNLAEVKLPEGEHQVCLQGFLTGKYRAAPEIAKDLEAKAAAATEQAAAAGRAVATATEQLGKAEKDAAAAEARLAEARARNANPADPAAAEALHTAESSLATARAAVEQAALARKAAETAAAQAEALKTAQAAAAKAATERAQPRDVTVRVYSQPLVLRVAAPPKT